MVTIYIHANKLTVHRTTEVTIVLLRLQCSETFVQCGGTTSYLSNRKS